ncbi:hypothetical protein SEVIR_2G054000v4 [Setaria viridis]|uniref:Generative cell specific-1/HAP2 domain-containing protein n=1 Tax=Setaria viridis TaxID=4556 RepID=A0A4U6VNK2_SETVI|nr:protein HAPLESS 2-A [Setaria viridis]TKW30682.1 hypothetical protein SEVIR_2G054000v2 [Setaria viridis]
MSPPRALLCAVLLLAAAGSAGGTEVLSKSRLERCKRDSDAGGSLSCAQKLVLDLAVPAGSSGGEASLVTKVVDVVNGTEATRRIRDPPVITVSKSAVSAVYALTYLMDVVYKPEEHFVETRKCEPYAGSNVVGECERLWHENGTVIEHTEPVCCPCGPNQRAPTSCGNFFDKLVKGKRNTAHCLRFPGDRSHVWGIGPWSLGFSIRVQVKKGSSVTEVVVGPENRTVISSDNFLKVNLVGDYAGYTSIPTFEDVYLVTPRKGAGSGQPQDLGDEHIKWMLLERVRFGPECNQIGVGYKAFQNQPSFCSSPVSSCLNEQLWNFWESDKSRIDSNQVPLYIVEGRFQRINQHPNAGAHSFSVGVTEALSSNLLLELSADDIEYSYQRSPGKIMGIDVATFEALSQVGTAKVTTMNIGKLEASYRLTFNCLSGISKLEEQYYVMKPGEVFIKSFDLHSSSNEAEKYQCAAILKASDFTEVDRVECQFSTTATVFNNGTQIGSTNDHKEEGGIWGLLEAIRTFCFNFWDFVTNFLTGKSCSWTKCSSLFDIGCHFQYICIGWVIIICLVVAMLPIGAVVLWLLHQKGFFDPVYDWWEDLLGLEPHGRAHLRHRKGHHRRRRHHHQHSHHHGDYHQHRHHHVHLQRHHHVEQPEAAAEEGHRRHRHDPTLGVQHRGGAGHKHGHGKAVAAAVHFDGPSRLRDMEDAVEFREWRRDEVRHAEHGMHGHDRRQYSRF